MRAAGYVRVSTQEQADKGWNLGEDKRLIEERCQREGWNLIEVYDDGGRQGDDPDRPGLRALLDHLDQIDVVIMRSQDRISRDIGIWAMVSTALRTAGIRVETFTGPIDLESASGEFMANVMAAVGKFEKRRTGERVKQAAGARAHAGRHHGRAPFGYRSKEGKLVIVPAEAAVVRRIFRECTEAGLSQRETARGLNCDGIRAQRGDWTQGTVSKLLCSPVYVGKLTFHGEVLDGIHEPIIDLDLWSKAEQLREANTRTPRGRTPTANHLLAGGTLRCRCGAAMYAATRPSRGNGVSWEAYTCARRQREGLDACDQPPVKRQPIDEAIWRFVTETALDLEATKRAITEHATGQATEVAVLRDQAERDVATVDRALAKIERDYLYGDLAADSHRAFSERLTAEHTAATAKVAALSARYDRLIAEVEGIDAESAVLTELSVVRAEILGQAREGGHAGAQAFRTALRRLFTGFELVPPGSFGVGGRLDGIMWGYDDRDVMVGAYRLFPYVRPQALEWDPQKPWAIRREPLPLRGSDDKTLTT